MDFVIHALLKELNGPVRERYREELIPPTDEESGFVEKVTKLFRKHQSGRVYGSFEADTNAYPFSRLLSECTANGGDFLSFSKDSAALLVARMKNIPAATGGYFFAARFTEDDEDLLLILMLHQEQGHAIDDATLTLKRSLNLQMQHLDLAARISITDWQADKPEPVSLVRGRKEVSEYFKSFIGLHEPRTNTEGTQKLKNFIEQWMETNNYSRSEKETVRERVLDYAKQRKDEPVELNVISTLVDPQQHEKFFTEANESGLGAEFHIDRRSLSPWVRVIYNDSDIKLNFSRRLLNKRVRYNKHDKTVLIKDIELSDEDIS
ncbi:MAG TPA: nucleoid-associated protein [Verrucomicrobiota bacterium]|nr:nucleoid-associated protein [Verrucomicrobiota bacterium]HQL77352.1 nucleoid-associated protein [Verrucomicrobiota bacterium]